MNLMISKIYFQLMVSFLIVLLFIRCKKENIVVPEPVFPQEINKKLISTEFVSQISAKELAIFAGSFHDASLKEKLKFDIRIYKLVYETTYKKNKVHASGLIYIPVNMTASAPILSVQHGTTFNKADAPSLQPFSGMEFFASAGYITLMPDFIGYGASSGINHPYYDAHHSAICVVDMIKAAKEFINSGQQIRYDSRLFLAGYSEGGYVTLATLRELETNTAHGLKVTASAAGAGGYDLTDMLQKIVLSNYYSYPAYLAFIIQSYNTVYDWNQSYSYFFNEPYASLLDTLLKGDKEGAYINKKLTTRMDSLFHPVFYATLKGSGEMTFKKVLADNSLTNWKPSSPIRLYHGTADEVIPYSNSEQTLRKLKENGASNIELYPVQDGNHGSSMLPMIESVFPWFELFPS
jgi:alpha-beta hydrolase superfamily lysophospholipase